MVNVESAKELVAKFAKPLIVRWVTRLVAYGTATALWKNLFGQISDGQTTGAVEWIVTGVMTAVALGIDYLYNRGNKKTETALSTVVAGIEDAKTTDPVAAMTVTDAIGDAAEDAGTTATTKAVVNAAIKANKDESEGA
jgi:hypothetical protein